MPEAAGFTAVILAAQRSGRLDPLAEQAGVSHKCLVPILGQPLIDHVLRALEPVPGLRQIRICIEPWAVDAVRAVLGAQGDVPVDFVPSAPTLADSIYAAAEGIEGPVLITTADNVLLSSGVAAEVVARMRAGAEGVFVAATREGVLAAHPEGQRRFYKFRGGAYSNCNLYGLNGARGLRLAEIFRSGGQFAKNPMRLAETFGLLNLLLARSGLVTLDWAVRRMSRRFGIRGEAVVVSDGSQAVDVDNPRTYAIAKALLERRLHSQGH